MARLIGLAGFKGAGKGQTFKAIQAALPDQNIQGIGFADTLKCLCVEAYGFVGEDAELLPVADQMKEEWVMNFGTWTDIFDYVMGRELLQNLGHSCRERFGENFWINQAARKIDHKADITVFTDVRYENEAEFIKSLGGEMWLVLKPDCKSDGHASEQPLRKIDTMLWNDGSVNELEDKVKYILEYGS